MQFRLTRHSEAPGEQLVTQIMLGILLRKIAANEMYEFFFELRRLQDR